MSAKVRILSQNESAPVLSMQAMLAVFLLLQGPQNEKQAALGMQAVRQQELQVSSRRRAQKTAECAVATTADADVTGVGEASAVQQDAQNRSHDQRAHRGEAARMQLAAGCGLPHGTAAAGRDVQGHDDRPHRSGDALASAGTGTGAACAWCETFGVGEGGGRLGGDNTMGQYKTGTS